jgi:membrane protein
VAHTKQPLSIWQFLREVFSEWSNDNAQRLGAALAYYSAFSIAPLIVIVLAVAGLIFGRDAATGQINNQLQDLLGTQATEGISQMLVAADKPAEGILAAAVSIVILLVGASGVFGELQSALNTIWRVEPKPGRGILGTIKDRFLSFTMVLGTGFLFLVSLLIGAALSALETWMGGFVPEHGWLMQFFHLGVSFAITTLLFALIYKVLPDVEIRWRDVWIGAIVTSLLFSVGKFAIGLYLGRSAVASSYGAAGSFIVVLIWVYYSSQILFLGAEFTKIHALAYGSGAKPAHDAQCAQTTIK